MAQPSYTLFILVAFPGPTLGRRGKVRESQANSETQKSEKVYMFDCVHIKQFKKEEQQRTAQSK